MKINVVLHSILRYKLARETRGRLTLDMPEDCTIQDILDRLQITPPINVSINNNIVDDFAAPLENDIEMHLFHPTGGGNSL
jgi:sulfur carrier protein ThiS